MTDLGAIELDDLPGPGDRVGGRYCVERVLGSGATGVVYEAAHELTGKLVAIKWLRPDLAASEPLTARFLREARAAAAIDHPNVVAVFDAGRERGSLFLVMERLHGEPLSSFLARGPHAPEVLVATLMPALRGVAAAHEHGIVHRDLKPDNVFLAEPRRGWPGGAKVLDFGISKLKQPADGRELTHAGVFLGSPLYMAPEQILEPSKVDARSDVYSLGVMLYEGLTGRVPFEADSLHELFRKVMTETAPSLRALRPELPEVLEAIVSRAMARERAARTASVEELARSLEPFAASARFDDDGGARDSLRPTPPPLEGGATEIVRSIHELAPGARDTVPPGGPEGLEFATQPAITLPEAASAEPDVRLGATPAGARNAGPSPRDAVRPRALLDAVLEVLPEPLRAPIVVAAIAAGILLFGFALGLAF